MEEALPPLLRGAAATVAVSFAAILLGLAAGAGLAAAAGAPSRAARALAATYVSFFRGVPLLVQILLAYYALPFLGLDIPAIVAAVGTLGLCCAAYMAEILRGGLATVPAGAVEAARLLGLSTADVQADRLRSARQLADRFGCTAVLKGSGTVVAAPARTPSINPTGNALLATGEQPPAPPDNPMSADRVRWEHIQRVYELCDRNVSETARRLNMHRRTLQRILAKRSPK